MANKRILTCGKTEVLAIGEEGSFSDLQYKITPCIECIHVLGCPFYTQYLKDIIKTQENYIFLVKKIKSEQKLY